MCGKIVSISISKYSNWEESMVVAKMTNLVKAAHKVAFVAMIGASCAFANDDPYAGYVALTLSKAL